ncbi:MAG: NifU family protein [Bacteroidales bacterium]|jgi:Fe-S cluster biogenesis protein NfuA|nr:NifU family protein [Bacteroidales bacterium]
MENQEKATIEQKVIAVINQLRPYLQGDGGDLEYVEMTDENVVKVKLQGACGSCPHAKLTLKQGVEATLKKYVPEVKSVEDVVLGF